MHKTDSIKAKVVLEFVMMIICQFYIKKCKLWEEQAYE